MPRGGHQGCVGQDEVHGDGGAGGLAGDASSGISNICPSLPGRHGAQCGVHACRHRRPSYGQDSVSIRTTPKSIEVLSPKLDPGSGDDVHTTQFRSLTCIRC